MPYNFQFLLCNSVFQMEDAYLKLLWISPAVVDSVVWSQACECVTNSIVCGYPGNIEYCTYIYPPNRDLRVRKHFTKAKHLRLMLYMNNRISNIIMFIFDGYHGNITSHQSYLIQYTSYFVIHCTH